MGRVCEIAKPTAVRAESSDHLILPGEESTLVQEDRERVHLPSILRRFRVMLCDILNSTSACLLTRAIGSHPRHGRRARITRTTSVRPLDYQRSSAAGQVLRNRLFKEDWREAPGCLRPLGVTQLGLRLVRNRVGLLLSGSIDCRPGPRYFTV